MHDNKGERKMATKTVWWDKNGDQHEGWIKDGQTYLDEAGTTRVPVGATVQTAGGTYQMTSNGGVPTYATTKNQYEQNSNAAINAYQAAGKVHEERINSATNAAIAEINRQKQIAAQNRIDADKAAKEAYLKAANPFGALAEQRVRLGLDESGFAESSQLKLASAYAAQQTENLRAMNEQLSALDVQIAQAKASGQYELANILENRAQNIMQQKLAVQGNIYSGDMQAISQAENTRQFEAQLAEARAQEERNNKWNLAMAFIEQGKSAPFIAETLGIPQEDVNTFIAAVNAQKAASGGGNRYYGNGGNEDTQYLESLLPVIKDSGLTVNEWIEEYGSGYGITSADDKRALILLAGDVNSTPIVTLQTNEDRRARADKSPYGTQYNNASYNVAKMKREGKSQEEIKKYLNRFKESELTDEGIAIILGLM
jgi:hypothetical protein